MRFTTRLIYLGFRKAHKNFVRDTQNPQEATARLWVEIWQEVGESKHWREHRPSGASSLEDFPLSVYKDYQDTIAESYQSGESLLANSQIVCWGQSSGTTTKIPKVYPITALYRKQMDAVGKAHTYSFLTEFPDYVFGKALYFVANALEQTKDDKINRAHMSNYGIRKMPEFIFNYSSVIPRSIYLSSEDYLSEWGALYALAAEIEYTTMILPGIFHGLWNQILKDIDKYWPYLEGKTSLPKALPRLKCSAKRLKHLKEVFGRESFTMLDVWPTLNNVFSWRSGISKFQEDELQKVLGDVPIYNLPYCATEGYFTVPVRADSQGGAVHPGANLLEFLPIEAEALASNLVPLWELKEGSQYELVVTSTMGLIRYRMQDIVKCTGFFNRAPILEFVCKSAHIVRLSKTNIFETNLVEALGRANFKFDGKWIFGPNPQGNTLVLYLQRPEGLGPEWESNSAVLQLGEQLEKVDKSLQDVSSSYKHERLGQSVSVPAIKFLPYEHDIWPRGDILTTKPRILLSVAPVI